MPGTTFSSEIEQNPPPPQMQIGRSKVSWNKVAFALATPEKENRHDKVNQPQEATKSKGTKQKQSKFKLHGRNTTR